MGRRRLGQLVMQSFIFWGQRTCIKMPMKHNKDLLKTLCYTFHYNKSWIFKMFNLIKMYALTKRMFALTKGMGHERHIVLFVSFLKLNNFDQMLSLTFSQKGQIFKSSIEIPMIIQIGDIEWPCLVKLAIII